jgi:hypothetical protein
MALTKERALEVLNGNPDNSLPFPYLEAIANETLPQYYFDEIQIHKLYSDELPEHKLVAEWHTEYPLMKCRGNVIIGIGATFQGLLNDKIVEDQEIVNSIKRFRGYDWEFQKGYKGEYWTSREEINFINKTLRTVAIHIKNKYRLEDNTDSIQKKYKDRLTETRKSWSF